MGGNPFTNKRRKQINIYGSPQVADPHTVKHCKTMCRVDQPATCTDGGAKCHHIRSDCGNSQTKYLQSQMPLGTLLAGADCGIVRMEIWTDLGFRHLMKQGQRCLPHGPLLTCTDAGAVADDVGDQSGKWHAVKVVECQLLCCVVC